MGLWFIYLILDQLLFLSVPIAKQTKSKNLMYIGIDIRQLLLQLVRVRVFKSKKLDKIDKI